MANLLRLILELAEDPDARRAFRADPDGTLGGDGDLSGEDVAAAVDVVRVQVEPSLAGRMTDAIGVRPSGDVSPQRVAVHSLLALCDALDSGAPPTLARSGGDAVAEGPPGARRPSHLWAVDGHGQTGEEAGGGPARLQPVPDPPGGFEFAPLELVRLPVGVPEAGVEPGATATIVAVHRQPHLHYEIEVSGEDGGRRFLGTVPPSSLERY